MSPEGNAADQKKRKKRIKLTKNQEIHVEKTVDTSKLLTRGVMEIGMAIDVLTGGATLGIPTIVGGLISGIGTLIDLRVSKCRYATVAKVRRGPPRVSLRRSQEHGSVGVIGFR